MDQCLGQTCNFDFVNLLDEKCLANINQKTIDRLLDEMIIPEVSKQQRRELFSGGDEEQKNVDTLDDVVSFFETHQTLKPCLVGNSLLEHPVSHLVYHGEMVSASKKAWWNEGKGLPKGQSEPYGAWFSTSLDQAEISGKAFSGITLGYKLLRPIPLVYVKKREEVFDAGEDGGSYLGEQILTYLASIGFQGYFSENECELALINERVDRYLELVGIVRDNRNSRSYSIRNSYVSTRYDPIRLPKIKNETKCSECGKNGVMFYDNSKRFNKRTFCNEDCQTSYYSEDTNFLGATW